MTGSTRHASLVWLALMLATCITTWGLSKDAFAARVATVSTIAIAAVKIRLVLLHFMELRHAPWPWRLFFEGWVVVCAGVVIGIYWFGA